MHRHRPGDREQPPLSVGQVLHVPMEILVELELPDGAYDFGREGWVDRPHQIE